jgi:hypothetical protein
VVFKEISLDLAVKGMCTLSKNKAIKANIPVFYLPTK